MKYVSLLGTLLVIGACTQDASKTEESNQATSIDPCELLKLATFRSVKDHDSGLGSDGEVVYGPWTIQFRGETLTYQETDWSETAKFDCANGVITARARNQHIHGNYDAATRILVFAGREYALLE